MIVSVGLRHKIFKGLFFIAGLKHRRKILNIEKYWKWRQREGVIPSGGSFPVIQLEHCISCGLCLRVCPTEALKLVSPGPVVIDRSELIKRMNNPVKAEKLELDEGRCVKCTFCIEVCPTDAIIALKNIFLEDRSEI